MKKEAGVETVFFVGGVKNVLQIDVLGLKQDLPLSWTKGMMGVLPVFDNYEDAKRYAGEDFEVFSFEVKPVSKRGKGGRGNERKTL